MEAPTVTIDPEPTRLAPGRPSRGLWAGKRPAQGEFGDHAWDRSGETRSEAETARRMLVGAVAWLLFMTPFNYALYTEWRQEPFAWLLIGLLDVATLAGCYQTWRRFQRAQRFGEARLDFLRFPYRVGEAVDLVWHVPSGFDTVASGRFTLRCVMEWYDESRDAEGKTERTLVHEAQWQSTARVSGPCRVAAGEAVPLRFEPPAGLPPTALERQWKLDESWAVFWELDAKLSAPDMDYHVFYLVPVY